MNKLLLLALIFVTSSCSHFNPDRYADAAEEVAMARANGLGLKHPNRVALEADLRDRASENQSDNQAAIATRIRELEDEVRRLRADRFNKMAQKADSIDVTISELKKMQLK